jgi:prevent-host-death family protein
MNMKTMTASAASKEFGRYLDAAQREPVIITKQNRPVAVTVSFQDWEELTKLRTESGLRKVLGDLEHGRFEEMNDENTTAHLSRFKDGSTSVT